MISNLCSLNWYIARIQTDFPLRQQGENVLQTDLIPMKKQLLHDCLVASGILPGLLLSLADFANT